MTTPSGRRTAAGAALLACLALAGCGDDEPTGPARTWGPVDDQLCVGLDAAQLVATSYPDMQASVQPSGSDDGGVSTGVCELFLRPGDDASGRHRFRDLSISILVQSYHEGDPRRNYELDLKTDYEPYLDETGHDLEVVEEPIQGWWQTGSHRQGTWLEEADLGGSADESGDAGYYGTDAVLDDNVLVSIQVLDQSFPAGDLDANLATHDDTVATLLDRVQDVVERNGQGEASDG